MSLENFAKENRLSNLKWSAMLYAVVYTAIAAAIVHFIPYGIYILLIGIFYTINKTSFLNLLNAQESQHHISQLYARIEQLEQRPFEIEELKEKYFEMDLKMVELEIKLDDY